MTDKETKINFKQFYEVIEQIPVWFDQEFEKGYSGGSGLVSRPRVEDFLRRRCGQTGYISILCYVLTNYKEMRAIGESTNCDSVDYANRFKYPVWYNVALILFNEWSLEPRFGYINMIKKLTQFKVTLWRTKC